MMAVGNAAPGRSRESLGAVGRVAGPPPPTPEPGAEVFDVVEPSVEIVLGATGARLPTDDDRDAPPATTGVASAGSGRSRGRRPWF
jgi:hypothetical protein